MYANWNLSIRKNKNLQLNPQYTFNVNNLGIIEQTFETPFNSFPIIAELLPTQFPSRITLHIGTRPPLR